MVQKWRKAGKKEKETVNVLKCMREVEKKNIERKDLNIPN